VATKTELKKKAIGKKRSFHQELVLNRWMLGFFKGGSMGALKLRLGDDRHEGIDEDGQTKFFHELTRNLFEVDRVSEADLRRYDLSIVAHWQAITAQRNKMEGHELQMKYFQYLSLLFTEIYLDWYFNRRHRCIHLWSPTRLWDRFDGGSLNLLRGKTSRTGMFCFRKSQRETTYRRSSSVRWLIPCAVDSARFSCTSYLRCIPGSVLPNAQCPMPE